MFHTEHTRVILPPEWASLRRDTGECHSQLHPHTLLDLLPPQSSVIAMPKRSGACPVRRWQRIQLNHAVGSCVESALPVFRDHNGTPASLSGITREGV